MKENQFWNVHSPDSTSRCAEWVHGEMKLKGITCPIKDGHQRGGKRLNDLSVHLRGGAVQDFVWTWYSECLIQDHVLELFRSNGFTGFEVKPVKAQFKRPSKHEIPKLWELIVTGWAGVAPTESGVKLIVDCPGCGHLHYSGCEHPERLIDVSKWDGSDFFMVWPWPNGIFVTDRVAQVIRDHRLKGAVLRQPHELNFSSGGFSPGRLSYSMPEKRARELGEPLGIY